MANFMKKVPKAPRPLKPVKTVSEVDSIKNESAEEKKVEEIKISEQPEIKEEVSEKTEPVVADPATGRFEGETEEERIDRQVEEMFGPDSKEESVEVPEQPVETPPEPDPEPEEKPKTKKKSNKKKKKEEVKIEAKENKKPVDLETAEELMLDIIMPCAEGWAEEKERVNGMLSKIVITEELDPTSVKALIADMSAALRELIMLATESKVALSNLKDLMEEIRIASSTGANSEERKMNGMYAMRNYEHEESIVDLTVLLKFYRERQEFYDSCMKEIEVNRQMLITFASVFKIELGRNF